MSKPKSLLIDCYDPESGLVPLELARERILDATTPAASSELVELTDAYNRVLAEDVLSPMDVPPHNNSAMDGFAVRGEDLLEDETSVFRITGEAFAGHPFADELSRGETVRIMTGAPLPRNADTVVMQERVEVSDQKVIIPAGEKPGQNTRSAGEDIKQNNVVIKEGVRVGAPEIGILSSLGLTDACVRPRLSVALVSTGDEIKNPGEQLAPGQIFDSNRPVLNAMLQSLGCKVIDLGIVPDQRQTIDQTLINAAEKASVIISSGGASTGVADFISEAMRELGELGVWRIALRPGRPFGYGTLNKTHFFGLPGNPVAVMTTFYSLVEPALRKLMGETNLNPVPELHARLTEDLRKKPGRTEYYRAILSQNENNERVVATTGKQGSGMLHSMHKANCFIVLPHDADSAKAGDLVPVHPFYGVY